MSDVTKSLVERLRDQGGWKAIIEKHRNRTDDPSITYVLKDGTRVNENDSVVAKLAASLSKALEEMSDVVNEAAAHIEASELRELELRKGLMPFASAGRISSLPDSRYTMSLNPQLNNGEMFSFFADGKWAGLYKFHFDRAAELIYKNEENENV